MNKDEAKTKYADIIGLPYRQSAARKHMSMHDRAAQFAPFAALSGYEDMIAEKTLRTIREAEASESMADCLPD